MKRKLIFAASLLAATFIVNVQTSVAQNAEAPNGQRQDMTPEQRVEAQLKRWTKALSLTTEQVNQVKPLLTERTAKREAIRNASDRRAAMQELRDLTKAQDEKLKTIFTAEQLTKYAELQEEMRGRGGNGGGRREGGNN
ncbi:hypothetical protein [Arcicella rosea]|uniref:Spy/CpxP family protein refolding chaperone n=1 Tax=Arcicella rosea TaxID=502909 RepID=A0A841ERS9_9BACT|nr:hypothetical protein [Arcicella rosea]MBB6002141.1 Spy/CpxP family protein refolding chaperone [Arcicella rosea]